MDRIVMVEALTRVGELLKADGSEYRILIGGGAALNLLGIVNRVTTDVDIIAFGTTRGIEPPPVELPDDLLRAARRVKLHAAVDSGPSGVLYADLLALQPTPSELIEARAWVETQDASPEFRRFVEEVVHRVERDLERAR